MRTYKIFIIILLFILLPSLFSCNFEKSEAIFIEGEYIYNEANYCLFDNNIVSESIIEINELQTETETIEFNKYKKIDEKYNVSNISNIIVNRANNQNYYINIYYKLLNRNKYCCPNIYSIESSRGKVGSNSYYILVDYSDLFQVDLIYIYILRFENKNNHGFCEEIGVDLFEVYYNNNLITHTSDLYPKDLYNIRYYYTLT